MLQKISFYFFIIFLDYISKVLTNALTFFILTFIHTDDRSQCTHSGGRIPDGACKS